MKLIFILGVSLIISSCSTFLTDLDKLFTKFRPIEENKFVYESFADVQSLYVGMIKEIIYKNWRDPLAQEYNQEAVVSFFIFRGGNINKPFIKKSSGVEALVTLAVRAVLDSVPFPEFPKELKASNLHLEMYFKYVLKYE